MEAMQVKLSKKIPSVWNPETGKSKAYFWTLYRFEHEEPLANIFLAESRDDVREYVEGMCFHIEDMEIAELEDLLEYNVFEI